MRAESQSWFFKTTEEDKDKEEVITGIDDAKEICFALYLTGFQEFS